MSSAFDIFDNPLPIPTPGIGAFPSSVPFIPTPALPTFSSGPVPVDSISSTPPAISPSNFPSPDTVSSTPIPTSSSAFPAFSPSYNPSSVPGARMNTNDQPYATGAMTGGSGEQGVVPTHRAAAPGDHKAIGKSGVMLALMLWLAAVFA